MKKENLFEASFPSTRFLGSKLKLLSWVHKNLKDLEFDTVLDVFGGTSSFSYLMKRMGKEVYYNDILKFNQIIAKALIENNKKKVNLELAKSVLRKKNKKYQNIIQKNFVNVYFKNHENIWLDIVIQNILNLKNKYDKYILLSSLFQACLIKRPFNLFHRNNLKLRTNNVNRSFGNKTTWETSFRIHFLKFVNEYNNAVFDNKRNNKVIGGYDALNIPYKKYDLVYLDPPYMSKKSKINYLDCYHFLEGLSEYNSWESKIDFETKTKKYKTYQKIENWINKQKIDDLFYKLIYKFRNSIIVLSYRNDGIPSIKRISEIFEIVTGHKPKIIQKNYRYALSNGSTKELLFISE